MNPIRRRALAITLFVFLLAARAWAADWKLHTGDNPAWASPAFDDSAWKAVPLPATWQEQGLQDLDGPAWFRAALVLDGEARLAAARDRLGLLLGASSVGGYEVYADGRLLGRSRGWSSELPFARPHVFRVPREAVGQTGTLHLAIRVRRVGWASDADADAGPAGHELILGPYPALYDRTRVAWTKNLLNEVPLLILAALFTAAVLYHLLLFGRRREQVEHLWFGLLALAFAVNTLASTYWIYELTASRGIAVRTSDLSGHLAAALAIQFIWSFFNRPIAPLLRTYQVSHLAIAAFIGFWPNVRPVLTSSLARTVWLLPLLVLAATLVIREAWRGEAEAHKIALGGIIMIGVEALELARQLIPLPIPLALTGFGFAAVLVAMGIGLSDRFRRVHDELDRLRLRLEEQVRDRTRALEGAMEKALAASRVKSEFLANISHEVRTPLNGVLGMAEILAVTDLDPQQREYLQAIQTSGSSLLALIDDVLDFSRMDSKKLTVERTPFVLKDLVAECLEAIAPMASRQSLAVRSTIAEGTPEALVGDRARTRQILLELLDNAVKFTPSGQVHITLSARPLEAGLVEVRFAVSDTGIGIAAADLEKLFTPFQQLDGSASRLYSGAGLGLAMSKRLAELLGGEIRVESVPGDGSTFVFLLRGEPATAA
jgi:signal transduction histidine kinase